ncbi:uncharacterized protein Z520_10894 [Fonsecaea multimorphosa CBS 102226]|uniref:Cytochrome P450 n=1 Tax=Fonsecaea multimorphosa CBS 102226 TaxID=1442371 RepID=A0A0D2JSQ2_9EURO|nr:uncharacterized protein Z520_10894 [Fonsecaea multimorphosa CBS 102226]KIX93474.1 hypothetical protein Z520_10894 [Fonsecaea multimorphosa CBS 102226]OAL18646.1 hypothetical protein AYO22_10465 [Fonsecaea multimorphosa]
MSLLLPTCFWAVLSGLAAHLKYKRREPTLFRYLAELATLLVLASVGLFYQSRVFTTSVALSALFITLHLFALASSITVYRLFLHPLKDYPGPLLAKITKWYGFYLVSFGKTYIDYAQLHEKYGDVVRIGPNELSFADPESVKYIHGSAANKLAKGPNYDTRLWADGISLGDERDIVAHRIRRKFWDKGLAIKAITSYEPRLVRIINVLKSKFDAYAGKEIDVGAFIDYFGFDAMADLAFNETFSFIENEDSGELAVLVRKGLKMTELVRNVQWLAPIFKYLPMDPEDKAQTERFARTSAEHFEKRLAMGTKPTDLFTYLLAHDENGKTLAKKDLESDSPVIIVAGSDTTAVCLSFVFYFVSKDPAIQKRLIEEVDKAWAEHGAGLGGRSLGPDKMPYLNGVINESLRMAPPAPNGNQRTTPEGGCVVSGRYLPANTQVSCQPTFMAHDARSFTKPELFAPERWIDEERNPAWTHDTRSFIPFSAGQYICPGKALAYLEMRLLLAHVFKDFWFEMAPGFDHAGFWLGLQSYMGYMKKPIPLTVRRRQREEILPN